MRKYAPYYQPRSQRRRASKAKRNLILTLFLAVILIYFILSWGLPALVGSLSVFNKLKRQPQITTIEDTGIAPPVLNIPYEATNTATIKISGFSSPQDKVEIYVDDDLKDTTPVNNDGSFISGNIDLVLGTNNIYGKTVNPNGKKSLAAKTIRLIYNNDKPQLVVDEPKDGTQIKGGDKKVRVSGKTDPTNNISVNGQTVIIGSNGSFSTQISLNDGDNTITIVATNQFGNTIQTSLKVNYSSS